MDNAALEGEQTEREQRKQRSKARGVVHLRSIRNGRASAQCNTGAGRSSEPEVERVSTDEV